MNEKIREFKKNFPTQNFIRVTKPYDLEKLFEKENWFGSRSGLRLNEPGFNIWKDVLNFQFITVEMTTKGLVHLIKHNHSPWFVDSQNISNVPKFKANLYLSDENASFGLIMSEDITKS